MGSIIIATGLLLQQHQKLQDAIAEAAGMKERSTIRVVLTGDASNADMVCGCRVIGRGFLRRLLRRVF